MKKLYLLIFVFIGIGARAQEENKIVINEVKGNQEELLSKILRYPQFVTGQAVYLNGDVTEARFNYNYINNQLLFINPKGDTLTLTHGGDFNRIVIQSDTFCYNNKEFIQKVSHFPSYNLFEKRSLQINGSEKKGAYGTYSGTSAITSINLVELGNQTIKIASDQNIIYTFKTYYFLSGKFNRFYPASKKGFYDLFAKNGKQLKEFLEKNEIDYSKKEDLEKILEHMRSVVQ